MRWDTALDDDEVPRGHGGAFDRLATFAANCRAAFVASGARRAT